MDATEQAYRCLREAGWDDTEPTDDSPAALGRDVEAFRKFIDRVPELQSLVTASSDPAKTANKILQEFCRVEYTDATVDVDRRRRITKYKETFRKVLTRAVDQAGRGGGSGGGEPSAGAGFMSDGDSDVVPDRFMCPILFDIMENPVTASDGQTYERSAIERVLDRDGRSPFTRQVMNKMVFPNLSLRNEIRDWKEAKEKKNGGAAAGSSSSGGFSAMFGNIFGGKKTQTASFVTVKGYDEDEFPETRIDFPRRGFGTIKVSQLRLKLAALAPVNFVVDGAELHHRRADGVTQFVQPDATLLSDMGIKSGDVLKVKSGSSYSSNSTPIQTVTYKIKNSISWPSSSEIEVDAPDYSPARELMFKLWAKKLTETSDYFENRLDGKLFRPSACDIWRIGTSSASIDGSSFRFGDRFEPDRKIQNKEVSSFGPPRHLEVNTRQIRDRERTELTRLEAVKQLFDSFVNRSIAYNYPAAIGIMPFHSSFNARDVSITLAYETMW